MRRPKGARVDELLGARLRRALSAAGCSDLQLAQFAVHLDLAEARPSTRTRGSSGARAQTPTPAELYVAQFPAEARAGVLFPGRLREKAKDPVLEEYRRWALLMLSLLRHYDITVPELARAGDLRADTLSESLRGVRFGHAGERRRHMRVLLLEVLRYGESARELLKLLDQGGALCPGGAIDAQFYLSGGVSRFRAAFTPRRSA